MNALDVVPVSFDDACAFITEHHRHHKPPRGYKYTLGVAAGSVLVGVAVVGRPVAPSLQDGFTLEVTRTATDGTQNANSCLYAAAWRGVKAFGWRRLITYTQPDDESGASLRAAGWRVIAERPARAGWDTPSRRRDGNGNDGVRRYLWEAA